MPRKSNSRAAQGAGTIRKKTVTRKGTAYTYWEARITTGYDSGTGKQIQRSFSGKTQKEVKSAFSQAVPALSRISACIAFWRLSRSITAVAGLIVRPLLFLVGTMR